MVTEKGLVSGAPDDTRRSPTRVLLLPDEVRAAVQHVETRAATHGRATLLLHRVRTDLRR